MSNTTDIVVLGIIVTGVYLITARVQMLILDYLTDKFSFSNIRVRLCYLTFIGKLGYLAISALVWIYVMIAAMTIIPIFTIFTAISILYWYIRMYILIFKMLIFKKYTINNLVDDMPDFDLGW